MNVKARQLRLLAVDGKCLNVAVDHGLFNEASFLAGIEDMGQVVPLLATAGPDAIQLTPGLAGHLQRLPGAKPALVLRTDVANVYGPALPAVLFSRMIERAVEQAVRLDAAAVVVNLLSLPDQPDLHRQCLDNICRLKPVCDDYEMPLMIEPLVMQPNHVAGGYLPDGDRNKIVPLVRQAVELGADLIKADPCDDINDYYRVIEAAAGKPVLVRGGGRVTELAILERSAALMQQGAAGLVYGRNIIQHRDPAGMVRALMAVVHEGATPAQASAQLTPGSVPSP